MPLHHKISSILLNGVGLSGNGTRGRIVITISPASDETSTPDLTVCLENIRKYFRRVRNYIFGYLLGNKAGIELEELINIVSQATPITKRKVLVKLAYSTCVSHAAFFSACETATQVDYDAR